MYQDLHDRLAVSFMHHFLRSIQPCFSRKKQIPSANNIMFSVLLKPMMYYFSAFPADRIPQE